MRKKQNWLFICKSENLCEGKHLTLDVKYKGEIESSIIFRFNGKVYAYINRCVHMPRRLTCEKDIIFDDTGKMLRCSMHGIVYDPETGVSQSTMCNGQRLQSLQSIEDNREIFISDKRISAATV